MEYAYKKYNYPIFYMDGRTCNKRYNLWLASSRKYEKNYSGVGLKMRMLFNISSVSLFLYCIVSSACIHTLIDLQRQSQVKSEIQTFRIMSYSLKQLSEVEI